MDNCPITLYAARPSLSSPAIYNRSDAHTNMSMQTESFIPGKDASLESSIASMQGKLEGLGFNVEQRSWLNPVDGA